MNKSIKLLLTILAFFMIIGCSVNRDVFVGDTVDIENYNRPSNIVKYQWSFDVKPASSRLDPRDFIPSNYHPNVTFIPDVPGRYIVRLTMINNEGTVSHKNFVFEANPQLNYLSSIEETKEEKVEKPTTKTAPPPKIVEVPVVTEKVVHKKTTVIKKPNEWLSAPKPGQDPNELEQEPAYTTTSKTQVVEEVKDPVTLKSNIVAETNATDRDQHVIPVNAKYTLQVSSSTVEAFAEELKDKLIGRGYDAFIQESYVEGIKRYRIRVGHFATLDEAKAYRQKMLNTTEFSPWIDKIK